MNNDKHNLTRSQSHSESTPARSLKNLGRYLSLVGGLGSRSKEGIVNPMSQISEEDSLSVSVEDVQGADSGSTCTSMTRPFADSPTNNLHRESHLKDIKRTIARASSIVSNRSSLKGKSTLPGPDGFDDSWQGIEHYLRQRTKDTDPESLAPNRKPFHQRTWFACTIYGSLLALMLAAILALACTRSVIMPRMVLPGEIDKPAIPETQPVASNLQQSADDTTTPTPSTDAVPQLLKQLSDPAANSAQPSIIPPEVESKATPNSSTQAPVNPPQRVERRRNFHFILSLPGPLQRFAVGESSS